MLRQMLLLAHLEIVNNHPTLLPEQSLRSEEIRNRQALGLPRFHVKHGKWLLGRRGNCVV
ncbi:hypothetical protein BKH27_07870 [Actinomyces oris]|uniref:Uncharacterized protein n=1 Tax=Actinomyces oris TaxID=544580 RepID=A0A1Q8VXJ2_9ACTO|nr:hypothetical protein BKH27_07870 [Actinomyces oris]OLO58620.1 hypothetical protein BKH24_10475 [Actinomyces oris]